MLVSKDGGDTLPQQWADTLRYVTAYFLDTVTFFSYQIFSICVTYLKSLVK